jgi:hypothetical protein
MAASHLDSGLTPWQWPRHLDNSLEHLDGGLDTSTFP